MRRTVKLVAILIALVLLFGVAYMPRSAAAPGGTPVTKTYNLYATDGYYELPDGTPLYMYGFIGGDAAKPFVYQDTTCTPGAVGSCTHVNRCGDGTPYDPAVGCDPVLAQPPAPTGGPWTGYDPIYAGHAQFPAPVIYASTADVVEIRLKNLGVAANPGAPNDPHSIHLHGLDVDAANDGVPETSLGAVPANLGAHGSGNVVVYMFTSDHPGTYMYHCHQEAQIHVQMGMFGALVIYNPDDPAAATGPGVGVGGELYGLSYDKDYVMLVSEFDVGGHQDEEGTYGGVYNWAYYQPEYWSINGLSFPQTIHASFPSGYTYDEWLVAHPGYETLYTGSVTTPNAKWGTPGEKALLRVINMGFDTHPLHMHGYHGKVIGSDARGWEWANSWNPKKEKGTPFGEGLEKNTLVIGSGETYDWLVDFGQQSFASTYDWLTQGGTVSAKTTQSRYDPATNLPVSNLDEPTLFPPIPDNGEEGGPEYIAGPPVAGVVNLLGAGANPLAPLDPTQPGFQPPVSQYFPFHNHDDYKATNNGLYPGGMFTFLVPTP